MHVAQNSPLVGVCGEKVLPLINDAIPTLQAVYLFGSGANGRFRKSSDVDLAVLAADSIDSTVLFDLTQRCAQVFKREVDMIDFKSAPLLLRAQVVGLGIRFTPDGESVELDFYENQILSQYAAFVEERRPLVNEILRRRSIHAA